MRNPLFVFALLLFCIGVINGQFTWTHTDGPFGSAYSRIYSNNTYAFIPAVDFLFRSPDGEHWEKIEHPSSNIMGVWKDTIATLVVNPTSKKTELHISTDEGIHWNIYPVPPKVDEFEAGIYVCRSSVNIPLIGKNLMYRSFNLGASCDTIAYPGQFSSQIITLENRLYVLRLHGIRRSDENGNNWSAVIGPHFAPQEKSGFLTATRDSIILFATDEFIKYTHDSGITWTTKSLYPSNSDPRITMVGQDVYVQTSYRLYRSNDFGINWDTIQELSDEYINMSAALRNIYLYSSAKKGIYRWDENTNKLVQGNQGLSKGYIQELTIGKDKIWAVCANGVFSYDLLDKEWSDRMNIPEPDYDQGFISANEDGWVVTSGRFGGFYFSQNNGQTWTFLNPNGIYISGSLTDRVQLLGKTMMAITIDGVFRSVDKGSHWEWVDMEFIQTEIVQAHNKHYLASSNTLYESGDDGLTWDARSLPYNIIELGAFQNDLFLVSTGTDYEELHISSDGENWFAGGRGYYAKQFFAPYAIHNTYFRDEHYYYSLVGQNTDYITSIQDLTSAELIMTKPGNDYFVLDSVIYLGGDGMYVSKIEHPYITAIKEIKKTTRQIISVNPNPVSEIIRITIDPDQSDGGILNLYSADGILHNATQVMAGENQINISMKEFPASLYFVVCYWQRPCGIARLPETLSIIFTCFGPAMQCRRNIF